MRPELFNAILDTAGVGIISYVMYSTLTNMITVFHAVMRDKAFEWKHSLTFIYVWCIMVGVFLIRYQ